MVDIKEKKQERLNKIAKFISPETYYARAVSPTKNQISTSTCPPPSLPIPHLLPQFQNQTQTEPIMGKGISTPIVEQGNKIKKILVAFKDEILKSIN